MRYLLIPHYTDRTRLCQLLLFANLQPAHLDNTYSTCYFYIKGKGMTFREIERMIKDDGWFLDTIEGSHYHYKHKMKKGKVTIPYHGGTDIPKRVIHSILKQANINRGNV